MPISPTSFWSKHLDEVRNTISNLSAFQAWTNTSTAALAKPRIYMQSVAGNGRIQPYIVVIERDLAFHSKTVDYVEDCGCELLFEMMLRNVQGISTGAPDDYYAITNPVGSILEELVSLGGIANTTGYINDPHVRLLVPPHWGTEGEQAAEGSWLSTKWLLTWKS